MVVWKLCNAVSYDAILQHHRLLVSLIIGPNWPETTRTRRLCWNRPQKKTSLLVLALKRCQLRLHLHPSALSRRCSLCPLQAIFLLYTSSNFPFRFVIFIPLAPKKYIRKRNTSLVEKVPYPDTPPRPTHPLFEAKFKVGEAGRLKIRGLPECNAALLLGILVPSHFSGDKPSISGEAVRAAVFTGHNLTTFCS